ncbi:hypothetical protein BASA61_005799 [Batrachochytrium salamandrivorans]|nr:hypothetical protein BASA61_005799 [Batrachochytrium salamandrivorans]
MALTIKRLFNDNGIVLMSWPSYFSDLHQIENIWTTPNAQMPSDKRMQPTVYGMQTFHKRSNEIQSESWVQKAVGTKRSSVGATLVLPPFRQEQNPNGTTRSIGISAECGVVDLGSGSDSTTPATVQTATEHLQNTAATATAATTAAVLLNRETGTYGMSEDNVSTVSMSRASQTPTTPAKDQTPTTPIDASTNRDTWTSMSRVMKDTGHAALNDDLVHLLKDRDDEIKSLRLQLDKCQERLATNNEELESKLNAQLVRNSEMEELVKMLQESLRVATITFKDLPLSSKPLSHVTKGRSHPRLSGRLSSTAASTDVDSTKNNRLSSTIASTDVDSTKHNRHVSDTDIPVIEIHPDTKLRDSESNMQESLRKKRIGMGGMNPLLGMGFNPSAVKLRSTSSTNLTDGNDASNCISPTVSDVSEPAIRDWLYSIVVDDNLAPDSGTALRESLRDGKLLCKLANTINKKDQIKINMGRFPAMHMENITHFLTAIESLGVPRHQLFSTSDLYDGGGMPRVLLTLDALRKIVVSAGGGC